MPGGDAKERFGYRRFGVIHGDEASVALADEIAHCPEMVKCFEGAKHPCSGVVFAPWKQVPDAASLRARWKEEHHTPEPWVGDIQSAPLLFLGPNPYGGLRPAHRPEPTEWEFEFPPEMAMVDATDHPSAREGRRFRAPKWGWSGVEVFDRYRFLFKLWVEGDMRARMPRGFAKGDESPYWKAVAVEARALLGSGVQHGEMYAVTEIVHCKSPSVRDGVAKASQLLYPVVPGSRPRAVASAARNRVRRRCPQRRTSQVQLPRRGDFPEAPR